MTTLARYNAACTYSLLGEIDRAIDLLEIYLRQVGPIKKYGSRTIPISTPSRHPRYQKLLELAG